MQNRFGTDADTRVLVEREEFTHALNVRAQLAAPVALTCMEFDGFATLATMHGHDVAMRVLGAVAERVAAVINGIGLMVQTRPTQYMALLPDHTLDEASQMAKEMLKAVNAPVSVGPDSVVLTLSIGVAGGVGPLSATALLEAGGTALSQARELRQSDLMQVLHPVERSPLATEETGVPPGPSSTARDRSPG